MCVHIYVGLYLSLGVCVMFLCSLLAFKFLYAHTLSSSILCVGMKLDNKYHSLGAGESTYA